MKKKMITAQQILEAAQVSQHIRKLLDVLHENLARANRMQQSFLEQQSQALRTIAAGSKLPQVLKNIRVPQALINKTQLQEFGTGSIAKCFGPDFAELDQRKTPRIPNGDLLMMDRVTSLSGIRGDFNAPAEVTTEMDIPKDAWFIAENSYPGLPMVTLMEMALQPCGILSAYLGTSLSLPADVNLFRNLDGVITFSANTDLSGSTVRNHARMLSSVTSGGMLIQKYSFELSAGENVFLAGESSFGYFQQAAMDRQTGLDAGAKTAPSLQTDSGQSIDLAPALPKGSQHFDLIDQLRCEPQGGQSGQGVIIGSKKLSGSEWFYKNHFYQDPVMPGSLGVEAILQALWAYLKHTGTVVHFHDPQMDFSQESALTWKYRGQVVPTNKLIQFAAYIKEIRTSDTACNLLADADFWVDGMRIYSIQNISLTVKEGN